LDAANLLPAIDDNEVEVYGLAPDKNNGYGAGAVWVHGIGGTLVNKRQDHPVETLRPFSVAAPLAVTDDASDGGERPNRRNSAGKGGAEVALDAFERTLVRAGIGLLLEKYIPEPQEDKETEHEAGFGWYAALKHEWSSLFVFLSQLTFILPTLPASNHGVEKENNKIPTGMCVLLDLPS
jgi:hypothetical protein